MRTVTEKIKEGGKTFYLTTGSLQYFGGDVDRITKRLRRQKIRYRVKHFRGMNAYIIYVNKKDINIHDFCEVI